ncbi:Anchored repeat ABC transporter, substrate-binding protein [Corynebacterium camporealensis]|uniref:Anchored repeat ABC transporter, substrate-binding protein n=1 Tax=Corynebacterium camporealensis TaxID=161896 RepID=A0A0F6QYH0_9CORY|nr:anchored repeat ABC transporter, substrate-binding protein [Corynebacterium camporealensis]AVH89212.1 Anchored repeat ABC transporter, substrate-binding protein [Corynebacterium camporealensis]
MTGRCARALSALALTALGVTACAPAPEVPQRDDGVTDVVTTTGILADLAQGVAGDAARVTALVPPGADPHSFEPGLRDIRTVAHADLVLANHLLLEDQALMDTVRNARPESTELVTVSEDSETYGATLIPLVEDLTLDTPWLGAQVVGDHGAGQAVDLVLTESSGPGEVTAYLTGTFGQPVRYFDTSDGVDDRDKLRLPTGAHTHLSWSFTEAGRYELDISARDADSGAEIGAGSIRLAVGVDPGVDAVREGHVDVAVDTHTGEVGLRGDDHEFSDRVVEVPARALQQVPPDPAYRFLGQPGAEVYVLPQAVLGKHVHGEIDPHTWHDPANAAAAVRVIEDKLAALDPANAETFAANSARLREEIDAVDKEVRALIDDIPPENRNLVTTHDGYGYLAAAYDLNVAGVVSPNPAVEPSARDVIALTRTLQHLEVPAVFLEPTEQNGPGTLSEIARDLGLNVCTIHGDMLSDAVPTYLDLMKTNALTLRRCLQ